MSEKRQIGPKYTSIDNRFISGLARYLSGHAFTVYVHLCCAARDRAIIEDLRIDDLIAVSGLSWSTVTRAMAQLTTYGFITKQRTQHGNIYHLPAFEKVLETCARVIQDEDGAPFPSVKMTSPIRQNAESHRSK